MNIPELASMTFLEGFCGIGHTDDLPRLAESDLRFLLKACRIGDARLVQGRTTEPPPLMCVQDWPVEKACAVCYSAAFGGGETFTATVGDTEEAFAQLCYAADVRLGQPAACRHWLNWWDGAEAKDARLSLAWLIGTAIAKLGLPA